LGGQPEIIYNRKPETTLHEVSRQITILKRFCESRKNAVWIDTDISIEESVHKAMYAIHNKLSKRFKATLK
jgi:hypothetical protein